MCIKHTSTHTPRSGGDIETLGTDTCSGSGWQVCMRWRQRHIHEFSRLVDHSPGTSWNLRAPPYSVGGHGAWDCIQYASAQPAWPEGTELHLYILLLILVLMQYKNAVLVAHVMPLQDHDGPLATSSKKKGIARDGLETNGIPHVDRSALPPLAWKVDLQVAFKLFRSFINQLKDSHHSLRLGMALLMVACWLASGGWACHQYKLFLFVVFITLLSPSEFWGILRRARMSKNVRRMSASQSLMVSLSMNIKVPGSDYRTTAPKDAVDPLTCQFSAHRGAPHATPLLAHITSCVLKFLSTSDIGAVLGTLPTIPTDCTFWNVCCRVFRKPFSSASCKEVM